MKVKQLHRDRQPRGDRIHASASREGERAPQAAGNAGRSKGAPDANRGREYQGTGVLNKAGRFGSSTSPNQLGQAPEAASGQRRDGGERGSGPGPRQR